MLQISYEAGAELELQHFVSGHPGGRVETFPGADFSSGREKLKRYVAGNGMFHFAQFAGGEGWLGGFADRTILHHRSVRNTDFTPIPRSRAVALAC
jgi:hypothetical protein